MSNQEEKTGRDFIIKNIAKSPEKQYLEESLFNSKIFIHLNDSPLNDSFTQESDNTSELEEESYEDKPLDNLLINDLIEEIDSPKVNDSKENTDIVNFSDILLPLMKSGCEFLPKNYKPKGFNVKENSFGNIKNKKNFTERKGDWICNFCKNINFGFRTKCNRCNKPKEKRENKQISKFDYFM